MAGRGETLRRLRWRRQGNWLWPMFVGAVVGEGLLVHAMPISGDRTPVVGAILLAGVLNLLVVAVLGPAAGMLLRRRRADLPVVVARDYAGRALIVILAGVLALLGIGNRGEADAQRRSFVAQAIAAHRYIETQAPAVYRRQFGEADTAKLDTNLFRTCVPGRDRHVWLCVFVDTSQDPPGVTLDPSRAPNAAVIGSYAGGPGG
jgi:hypothetical protein